MIPYQTAGHIIARLGIRGMLPRRERHAQRPRNVHIKTGVLLVLLASMLLKMIPHICWPLILSCFQGLRFLPTDSRKLPLFGLCYDSGDKPST